jgi:hypothetical protein
VVHDGVRLRAIDFVSEDAVNLRLFLMSSPEVKTPNEVILSVLDEQGWERWCNGLGTDFARVLQLNRKVSLNEALLAQNRSVIENQNVAFAAIAPRGIGVTRWAAEGSFEDAMVRRRFALLGQTVDGQRVWDVRRAIKVLNALDDVKLGKLSIQGEREGANLALYAGLYEPHVKEFDLWYLSSSHREGATLLNVLKICDVPQALALALPRKVVLHSRTGADRAGWDWALRLQQTLGNGDVVMKLVGD